ncbi:hypothetical protein [Asticcacaulis sp.]|uniref:hypothetical protein n=1 Tax=Asticcacaulis sp. TaxID=1872648 RepID=UPI00391BB6E9
MKASASGTAPPRPDPYPSPHYALSEDLHFALDQLFLALDLVADLAEGTPGDGGTDLESRHYAPLFRTFSGYGRRLMADLPLIHERRAA